MVGVACAEEACQSRNCSHLGLVLALSVLMADVRMLSVPVCSAHTMAARGRPEMSADKPASNTTPRPVWLALQGFVTTDGPCKDTWAGAISERASKQTADSLTVLRVFMYFAWRVDFCDECGRPICHRNNPCARVALVCVRHTRALLIQTMDTDTASSTTPVAPAARYTQPHLQNGLWCRASRSTRCHWGTQRTREGCVSPRGDQEALAWCESQGVDPGLE